MSKDLLELCWKNFDTHINGALKNLREDENSCDFTLVCEDGEIRAHRVILSACSSVFSRVVGKTYNHIHPLLFLRGVSTRILANIVDYMYLGVVKIREEDLSDMFELATDLKVFGLTTSLQKDISDNENSREVPSNEAVIKKKRMKKDLKESRKNADKKNLVSVGVAADVGEDSEAEDGTFENEEDDISEIEDDGTSEIEDGSEVDVGAADTAKNSEVEDGSREEEENFSVLTLKQVKTKQSLNEINMEAPPHDDTNKDKILDGMLDKIVMRTKSKCGVSYQCRVCKKTSKMKKDIRRHAETHVKGFSHMCHYCGKFYKTRSCLRDHMIRQHKECKTEEMEDGNVNKVY